MSVKRALPPPDGEGLPEFDLTFPPGHPDYFVHPEDVEVCLALGEVWNEKPPVVSDNEVAETEETAG